MSHGRQRDRWSERIPPRSGGKRSETDGGEAAGSPRREATDSFGGTCALDRSRRFLAGRHPVLRAARLRPRSVRVQPADRPVGPVGVPGLRGGPRSGAGAGDQARSGGARHRGWGRVHGADGLRGGPRGHGGLLLSGAHEDPRVHGGGFGGLPGRRDVDPARVGGLLEHGRVRGGRVGRVVVLHEDPPAPCAPLRRHHHVRLPVRLVPRAVGLCERARPRGARDELPARDGLRPRLQGLPLVRRGSCDLGHGRSARAGAVRSGVHDPGDGAVRVARAHRPSTGVLPGLVRDRLRARALRVRLPPQQRPLAPDARYLGLTPAQYGMVAMFAAGLWMLRVVGRSAVAPVLAPEPVAGPTEAP
jgi:hypothetical protein